MYKNLDIPNTQSVTCDRNIITIVTQDHTEGHRANRLPCAQVGEDSRPHKLVTPRRRLEEPDEKHEDAVQNRPRGDPPKRQHPGVNNTTDLPAQHAAGNTSLRWGYSHR